MHINQEISIQLFKTKTRQLITQTKQIEEVYRFFFSKVVAFSTTQYWYREMHKNQAGPDFFRIGFFLDRIGQDFRTRDFCASSTGTVLLHLWISWANTSFAKVMQCAPPGHFSCETNQLVGNVYDTVVSCYSPFPTRLLHTQIYSNTCLWFLK